jgi:hypothetical protein
MAETQDRLQTHIDWEAIERSPEFQELVRKRRSFVVPATIFFLAYYMGFILLAGYAIGLVANGQLDHLAVVVPQGETHAHVGLPSRQQIARAMRVNVLSNPVLGLSSDPGWDGIEPFHFVMYEPNFGGPPTERTEALVCYDDEYMYFALRAYDSNPDEIRGNILYRDRFGGDDYFEVMLDTFNDNEHGVIFTTSPTGFRRDTEVSRDASGPIGQWLNVDYNTFWDAAGATTSRSTSMPSATSVRVKPASVSANTARSVTKSTR